jgi:hypothetical protein
VFAPYSTRPRDITDAPEIRPDVRLEHYLAEMNNTEASWFDGSAHSIIQRGSFVLQIMAECRRVAAVPDDSLEKYSALQILTELEELYRELKSIESEYRDTEFATQIESLPLYGIQGALDPISSAMMETDETHDVWDYFQ